MKPKHMRDAWYMTRKKRKARRLSLRRMMKAAFSTMRETGANGGAALVGEMGELLPIVTVGGKP